MVNTFLVCSDFRKSAERLADKHLFKQAVEAKQIINIYEQGKKGFSNHPAAVQWKGHLDALKLYFNCHLEEINRRGKWDTEMKSFAIPDESSIVLPWWVKCPHVWYSHSAALYSKQDWNYSHLSYPAFYKQFGYFWPSKMTEDQCGKYANLLSIDIGSLEVKDWPDNLTEFATDCFEPEREKTRQCTAKCNTGKRCNVAAIDGEDLCKVHRKVEIRKQSAKPVKRRT
jgi:hypothetical protein